MLASKPKRTTAVFLKFNFNKLHTNSLKKKKIKENQRAIFLFKNLTSKTLSPTQDSQYLSHITPPTMLFVHILPLQNTCIYGYRHSCAPAAGQLSPLLWAAAPPAHTQCPASTGDSSRTAGINSFCLGVLLPLLCPSGARTGLSL